MPDFDLRLRLYSPSGIKGRVLKTSTLDVTHSESGTAMVRFSASRLVTEALDAPFVVGVEYSMGGTWIAPRNNLAIAIDDDGDTADPANIVSFTAQGYVPFLLGRAEVKWSASAKNQERLWVGPGNTAVSAGYILGGMITEAKARNWANGTPAGRPTLLTDFSGTADSAGVAWTADDKDKIPFRLLTKYSQVLDTLASQGMCDWWAEGLTLRLMRYGTGADKRHLRLGGPRFTRAPLKSSFADVFTNLTVVPEKARNWLYLTNVGADTRFGVLEASMTLSGIESHATATKLAQPALIAGRAVKREYSYVWTVAGDLPAPWRDFNIGDTVKVRGRSGWVDQRVVGLVISKSLEGVVTCRAVTGTKLKSADARLIARAGAASIGGIIGGTHSLPASAGPVAVDPAVPAGLHIESNVGYFAADGTARARVEIAWDEVVTATDGSELDVDEYEVWHRVAPALGSRMTATTDLSVVLDGWESGVERLVKVRARSVQGVYGEFSPEISVTPATPSTAPLAPTAPVLSSDMGVVTATWDGKLDGPVDPAPGFQFVYAEASTSFGGTYTRVGQNLGRAGGIVFPRTVGETVWVRFRAIGVLGHVSAASASVSVVVAGVLGTDIDDAVTDWITGIESTADAAEIAAADAQLAADDAADAAEAARAYADRTSTETSANPYFTDWPGSLPVGWTLWNGSIVKETGITRSGVHAARFNVAASGDSVGIVHTSPLSTLIPDADYLTVSVDVYLVSGGLSGSGVIVDFRNNNLNRVTISFNTELPGAQTGRWYTLSKTVKRPNTTGTAGTAPGFYLMANWAVLGGAVKNIVVGRFSARTATQEEIRAILAQEAAAAAQAAAGTAQSTADAAVTSASGRNALYHATTSPSGSGTRVGDIWHQWSSLAVDGRLLGTWVWTGSWQKRLLDETYIPLLNIGSGTYGSLNGDRLTARTVTTKQLLVGDLQNYAIDVQTAGERAAYALTTHYEYVNDAALSPGGANAPWFWRLKAGALGYANTYIGERFRVEPGEKVFVSGKFRRESADRPVRLNLYITDSAGGVVAYDLVVADASSSQTNGQWVTISGQVTIPAGGAFAQPMWKLTTNTPAMTGEWLLASPVIRRTAGGELIIDGSLKARHIDVVELFADSSTFGKMQSQHAVVGFRPAQGSPVNRVPAAMTDTAYWNQLKAGAIVFQPLGLLNWSTVTVSAAGIQLSTATGSPRYATVTALNPAPASLKLHVKATGIGALGSATNLRIRSFSDAAGTSTISDQGVDGSADVSLPSNAKSYQCFLMANTGIAGTLVSQLEIFEVIGSGGSAAKVEIAPSGVSLFNDAGDETVYLGTARSQVFSVSERTAGGELAVVAAIDSDGAGQFASLTVRDDVSFPQAALVGGYGDLTINGQFIDTPYLERNPRGVVFSAGLGTDYGEGRLRLTDSVQYRGIGIGEVTFDPGRLYTVGFDSVFIRQWTSGTPGSSLVMEVFIGDGTQSVGTPNTTNGAQFRWPLLEGTHPNSQAIAGGISDSRPIALSGTKNILVRVSNVSTRAYSLYNLEVEPRVVIKDVGPAIDAIDGGSISTRAISGNVTPPVSNVVKTVNFGATWSVLWGPSGTIRPASGSLYDDGRMLQGGLSGSRAGQVGFGPLGLSGKTPTGMWIRLRNRHTLGQGSNVKLGTHGLSSAPGGGAPNNANTWTVWFPRGTEKWVPIPSGLWAGFIAGTYRGVTLGGPNVNTGSEYYIFDGLSTTNAAGSGGHPPILRVSYKG